MQPSPILLVEDDEDDIFLVQRALAESGITNRLIVVRNGVQAINYLAGSGQYADRQRFPWPSLVLLDLDLPIKSGFDVLTWLRHDQKCMNLPVVVLTGSSMSPDVSRAYRLGANSFLVKPSEIQFLKTLLTETVRFWEDQRLVDH